MLTLTKRLQLICATIALLVALTLTPLAHAGGGEGDPVWPDGNLPTLLGGGEGDPIWPD